MVRSTINSAAMRGLWWIPIHTVAGSIMIAANIGYISANNNRIISKDSMRSLYRTR